ncbi:MAG: hypothetical protein GXY15_11510 [Candidatus Hydrogenedentes bacterium]|nr:hypothetical protein [Candidatus Hydrogenedentota bacterium]
MSQDPPSSEEVACVTIGAKALAEWPLSDDPAEKAWRDVSALKELGARGLVLSGDFTGIRRIDNLDEEKPGFWAPLSSLDAGEQRPFPLSTGRFPILEITYKFLSSRAHAELVCFYSGGECVHRLDHASDWTTAAVLLHHRGFPDSVTGVAVRLYAHKRTEESIEIESLRFRAMTPAEKEAWKSSCTAEARRKAPPGVAAPADFFPFGVFLNAATARKLADLMEIPFADYWRLALEDIARHHHNCVVVEKAEALGRGYGKELESLAQSLNIKVVPLFGMPLSSPERLWKRLADTLVKDFASSRDVLAWGISEAPDESDVDQWRRFCNAFRNADTTHPLTTPFRHPGTLPAFSSCMDVDWFHFFKSYCPWKIGGAVRAHLAVGEGRALWVTAPAFVDASGAPEWSSGPEMRLMINQALASGARGFFTYAYHNSPLWDGGHCERSLTGPFLTFSDLWAELGNRVERFSAMAPLFLNSVPNDGEPPFKLGLSSRANPRSRVPADMPLVQVLWMRSPDFHLCYLVSNDADQSVSVNLEFPSFLPNGMEIYDVTAFVRSRIWAPAEKTRHLEMFPGQGQLLLVGDPEGCSRWRDIIAERILEEDRRQVMVDIDLARKYRLDVADIETTILDAPPGAPLEALLHVHAARDRLTNLIYTTPTLTEARSMLIKASSIVCGCDEALSALYGAGKKDSAHELGVKVEPLAKNLTQLRLRLRRGYGTSVARSCGELVNKGTAVLKEIWSKNEE